jgi:hypothetical protein
MLNKIYLSTITFTLFLTACDFSGDALIGDKADESSGWTQSSYTDNDSSEIPNDSSVTIGWTESEWKQMTATDIDEIYHQNLDSSYGPKAPTQVEKDACGSTNVPTKAPSIFRIKSVTAPTCLYKNSLWNTSTLGTAQPEVGPFVYSIPFSNIHFDIMDSIDVTLIFRNLDTSSTNPHQVLFLSCRSNGETTTIGCKAVKICDSVNDTHLSNCKDPTNIRVVPFQSAPQKFVLRSVLANTQDLTQDCKERYGIGTMDMIDWTQYHAACDFDEKHTSRFINKTEFKPLGISL